MYINEVCKHFGVDDQFDYVKLHFKWLIDFVDSPERTLDFFNEADQWCTTSLLDTDFVIAPRRFYFRYLTDATLFRLIFS
jgi:hypothetical protein